MARPDPSLWPAGGGVYPVRDVPLTLAQVRDRLADLPGLSRQKRSDLRSALATVGRALGLPLDAIPATPRVLRDRLEQVSPKAVGIGKQSWANTRSRLVKALDVTGVPVMPGRLIGGCTPEWQRLQAQIDNKYTRCALTRFFNFCSVRGIRPVDVTPATFETFRTSIELESIRSRRKMAYRSTCLAWNEASAGVPGWPALVVPVPDHRDRYALPWSRFPASLKADIDAMAADAMGQDLVTMKAHRRNKPQSVSRRVENLQRLISGYVLRDGDPDRLRTLADVVSIEVVREGLRFHLERAGGKPTRGMDGMIVSVLTVARQWVDVPGPELEALKRLRRSLDIKRYEMTSETRALLRSLDDENTLAALLNSPGQQIRRCADRRGLALAEAVTASAALAVQILLDAPIRVRNLASNELGRHVIRIGAGRRTRFHLRFPAEEVKNDRPIELPLSEETAELLALYLDVIRPRLVRAPNSFLFPGAAACHKQPALLSKQIAAFMHDHVGIRVSAHKFRHLIGYLYLRQNPGAHEVVRQLLGHTSIETTIRYYAPLEQDEAFRLYDAFLDGLRERTVAVAPRRRRRC